MPLLEIKTNISITDTDSVLKAASEFTAKLLGKPESYVMINLSTEISLLFAGNDKPCAHLTLKSLGLNESETKAYSERLCGFISKKLNIDSDRVYIEFFNPERHLWGWNNSTF